METNDALKKVLMSKAEASIDRLLKSMAEGKEGDFQEMEQQVQVESREFGRSCLEALLEEKAKEQRPSARREGSCGHRQRLVGKRSRQILTILGPIVVHRAYYQCLRDKKGQPEAREAACTK
jgi:hypothetical protein